MQCSDLNAGAKLKMGRIKENVACKQSCKLGRWKNTCSEKNQSPHENKVCNWQNCSSLQFGTERWGKQQHTATPQIKKFPNQNEPSEQGGPLSASGHGREKTPTFSLPEPAGRWCASRGLCGG